MHLAAGFNDPVVAELLMRSGADIHKKDEVSSNIRGRISYLNEQLRITIVVVVETLIYASHVAWKNTIASGC